MTDQFPKGDIDGSRYIFVSYAHEDADSVYPEITRAKELGLDLWYDEGIRAGSSWRDELAEKIHDCALFVYFVSPRSVNSQHCLREVNYAEECSKPIIAIHLEKTELPRGLHMGLADRQAILKYELPQEEYLNKLRIGVETVFGDISTLQEAGDFNPPEKNLPVQTFFKKRLGLVVGAIAIVLLLVSIVQFAEIETKVSDDPAEEKSTPDPGLATETTTVPVEVETDSLAIAVLPFVNMSSDPDNEYFSIGISEEILDALVKTRSIDVIARTSSFQFKGQNISVQKIGDTLNVSHILEGSVRKFGNEVRITAQLIDAESGVHLWSDSYNRELTNVFKIQGEIAAAIVIEIGKAMSGGETWDLDRIRSVGLTIAQQNNVHPAAYELYLQALHRAATALNTNEFFQALALLEQATKIDPEFGAPWLLIANMQLHKPDRSLKDNASLARPALEKLLSLEPDNPRGLALMGSIEAFVNYRWREGEVLLRRAIQLAPSDARIHTQLGVLLGLTNRRAESLQEHEIAYQLDPLNVPVVINYVDRLKWAGRHKDAARIVATIENFMEHSVSVPSVVDFYLENNQLEKAAHFTNILRTQFGPDNVLVKVREARYAKLTGNDRKSEQLESELWARFEKGDYVPANGWSDDELFLRIERAIANREWFVPFFFLAFATGDQYDDVRSQLNLDDFDVRASHVASKEEKAAIEEKRIKLPEELLDKYSGLYIQEDMGWTHEFYREGDKLMFYVQGDGYRGEAIPLSENLFINECCVVWRYTFTEQPSGRYTMKVIANQITEEAKNYQTYDPGEQFLSSYTGNFESTDLGQFSIQSGEGKLLLSGNSDEWDLYAVDDEGLFFTPLRNTKVRFKKDKDQLELEIDGDVNILYRIKQESIR